MMMQKKLWVGLFLFIYSNIAWTAPWLQQALPNQLEEQISTLAARLQGFSQLNGEDASTIESARGAIINDLFNLSRRVELLEVTNSESSDQSIITKFNALIPVAMQVSAQSRGDLFSDSKKYKILNSATQAMDLVRHTDSLSMELINDFAAVMLQEARAFSEKRQSEIALPEFANAYQLQFFVRLLTKYETLEKPFAVFTDIDSVFLNMLDVIPEIENAVELRSFTKLLEQDIYDPNIYQTVLDIIRGNLSPL